MLSLESEEDDDLDGYALESTLDKRAGPRNPFASIAYRKTWEKKWNPTSYMSYNRWGGSEPFGSRYGSTNFGAKRAVNSLRQTLGYVPRNPYSWQYLKEEKRAAVIRNPYSWQRKGKH
ncbi:unnamed protein product, partial [Mesorhabditis belari]|uniref:Uncharacterized protein n=1 Tax=Mesorhabditis belari TaxID=2138241 RepID=A0AAF3J427_9BILA